MIAGRARGGGSKPQKIERVRERRQRERERTELADGYEGDAGS